VSAPKSKSDPTGTPPAPAEAPAEVEFELSLEDTIAQQRRGLFPKGKKADSYNPYDMDTPAAPANKPSVAADPKRRPTDLRKLSEWIRLQRQVEALKKDGPDSK
jgi:hypothetical protein